ncbi:hypothetical protein [Herbaspirillum hiltneri]|nr:hypothetical protein [Herbaspirillum hiltneri]
MSFTIAAGTGPSNIPSAGEMNSYSNGLKTQSTDSLLSKLSDPSTEQWQKDAITKELQNRADANQQAQGAGGGEGGGSEDMQQLLKKLQDGTITDEELQKLAKMLGVDPAKLEAMKGKGDGEHMVANGDIQGG